jgi:hypothetical protein
MISFVLRTNICQVPNPRQTITELAIQLKPTNHLSRVQQNLNSLMMKKMLFHTKVLAEQQITKRNQIETIMNAVMIKHS